MGQGCDCSHCPGCGDKEEPKKKGSVDTEPEEEIEEVDLGDEDIDDDDDEEE